MASSKPAARWRLRRVLAPLLVCLFALFLASNNKQIDGFKTVLLRAVHSTGWTAAVDGEQCSCSNATETETGPLAVKGAGEAADGLSELPSGTQIPDCCCSVETVDELVKDELLPLLSQLVKQPFFKYFRLDLHCDCPFWPEDGMCSLRDCSVMECEADDIPSWMCPAPAPAQLDAIVGAAAPPSGPAGAELDALCAAGEEGGRVNREMSEPGVAQFQTWRELDNPWTAEDESSADATYVNLLLNPERYTGYKGEHAHRVWGAIYGQYCFAGMTGGVCPSTAPPEHRIFYRLISGTHASISAHVAMEYLIDERRGVWGPNYGEYRRRLASHPERLENLYFTTLFVLRAVTKAGAFLRAADYATGNPAEDALTAGLVAKLVGSPALRAACPVPFDEARLLEGGQRVQTELQTHFRNISAVMDCVGCEKCKLWGKLQILGLGTALKILFSQDPGGECPELARTEVIALVNLLHRLTESLRMKWGYAQAGRDGLIRDDSPAAGAKEGSGGGWPEAQNVIPWL